jgi:hypothetical protein
MRHIYYEIDIGYAACGTEGVMTVEDSATDESIDQSVHEAAMDYASSWEGDERLGWGHEDEDQNEVTDSFYENIGSHWRDATPDDLENVGWNDASDNQPSGW